MLSMVMMLSMSLGVAAAGALLTGFTDFTVGPEGRDTLAAFHKTFVCVGFMTAAAAWIFAQLSHAEPAQVLKRAEVDVE